MDKSQHARLKQVFEQAAEQDAQAHPLPEQQWESIAQKLAATAPSESAQQIQQAFENQASPELPPVNLWGNIAEQLDQNKIKESFEEQPAPLAPVAVWNDIEQQLEIESIWKRVHKALEKRTRWMYWREKAVQASLVLLVLLWLRGCDLGGEPIPPIATTTPIAMTTDRPASSVILPSTTANSTKNTTTEKETKSGTEVTTTAQASIYKTATASTISDNKNIPQSTTDDAPKGTTAKVTSAASEPSTVGNKNNSASTELLGTAPLVPAKTSLERNTQQAKVSRANRATWISPILAPTKKPTVTAQAPIYNNEPTDTIPTDITTTTVAQTGTPLPNETTTALRNSGAIAPIALNNTVLEIQAVPTLPTPTHLTNPSILALEQIDLQRVQQARRQQQRHIELGMRARVKGTVLLGKATSEAMESSSMVKTRVLPTAGIGADFAWYFTRNDALIVSIHPMANSRQYFGGYTKEGRYYHKEIRLSYFDAELSYQRTLFRYAEFGVLPSSFYARVSYGLGYLNKGETIVNGLTSDETTVYNATNHSVGIALGNTHRINRFVVDYGIYSQLGLSTIHRQQPTDYRHLLGIGAYGGLRYFF